MSTPGGDRRVPLAREPVPDAADRFRVRYRRCLAGLAAFGLALVLAGLAGSHEGERILGITGATWIMVMFVVMVISAIVFGFSYRCPACDGLPSELRHGIRFPPPRTCQNCGAKLR